MMDQLIGKKIRLVKTLETGIIDHIDDDFIYVDFEKEIKKFRYPLCFAGTLELEDESLQDELHTEGLSTGFDHVIELYKKALLAEIAYLKHEGGTKYRAIDGELIQNYGNEFIYAFDTDTELNMPDGTGIKIIREEDFISASVFSCEEFVLMIRTEEYLGGKVGLIEFYADQTQLLYKLLDRLSEMDAVTDNIAAEIACEGKNHIRRFTGVKHGQSNAINRTTSNPITFIWGPPGTGKTETLANIALDFIRDDKTVLMLSYSNVSVDGALWRVACKSDFSAGTILRYGYPRMKEVAESNSVCSYRYVLGQNPELSEIYEELLKQKKNLKKKDPNRVEINKKISKIRSQLLALEKEAVLNAKFVATTVAKATMDGTVYHKKWDVVIFDEASMAYVPQIIFSAGRAKEAFVCLGDFRQLPAIVQNKSASRLSEDIFEYTGITWAVENECSHEWLVMLDTQYRMHYDIAEFVSSNMYSGLLKTSESIIASRNEIANVRPLPGDAMGLLDLTYTYSSCARTMDGSRINLLSALVSLRIAEQLADKYEIGIITPYSAQSRLILAMLRDMQERDEKYKNITTATVHQFQGSEKPIIIYDAVDCFKMPYPGVLLTGMKNDTANRLFNVALTRARGKFIMVANAGYLMKKHISKKLLFTKSFYKLFDEQSYIEGEDVISELLPRKDEKPQLLFGNREETYDMFLQDLRNARKEISIELPGFMKDDSEAINRLADALDELSANGIRVTIRIDEEFSVPKRLIGYVKRFQYVSNPATLIDRKILWFGHPISAADFLSDGKYIETRFFPCVRFKGEHTGRALQAFLEL